MALALYILCESALTLIQHEAPKRSIPGIIVAAVSVVAMPLLARAKRWVAAGIGSGAMGAVYRGVNTKVIPVVEHMDGIAVIRPVMHMLLRNGVPNMTGKPPLLQLRPANSHNNRKAKAEPARAPPAPADRQHQSAAQPGEKAEPAS